MLNPGDRCAICGRTDDPDLTAEPSAGARDPGRAETVEVEWGVRRGNSIADYGDHEDLAHADVSGGRGKLVRRTVTYGPWEEVPGDAG